AKLARAKQAGAWATPVPAPPPACAAGAPARLHPVVALGASTGGPDALARILKVLPAGFPAAVIIVQHIAAEFAPGLATWLQGQCALPVRLARDGDEFKPGEVLVAGTDDHLVLYRDRRLNYTADPVDYPYRPSVDVFFNSLAATWPRPGVAVLLTG